MSELPPTGMALAPAAVRVLHWPSEQALRYQLAGTRTPRLLVVPHGVEPPPVLDPLEDWVRAPADAADVDARRWNLQRRARDIAPVPTLDEHGLLRVGERWVAIPTGQLGVVELLLRRLGRLVSIEELTDAYVRAGGSGKATSIKTVVSRLSQRLAGVGLQLKKVRRRGVVLMEAVPC